MANPIVTSLPAYVEQQRLPLIAKSVLGAKSASLLTLQTGVKGPTAINLISTDVEFGDGKACGWASKGSTSLTQRTINPAILKVNTEFCDGNLIGKWAQSQVRIAAGVQNLPFEEEFTNGLVAGVKAAIEKMIWQGDSANPESKVEFDGLLKILKGEASVVKVTATAGTDAYAAIKKVHAAIPAEAYKEDTVIFVGSDLFREYIQTLVEKNLYHFNPNDAEGEYVLPGTAVRVIGVDGLNGTNKIVAGRLSEMFYGTDLEGDDEIFKLWYSDDNQEFRFALRCSAGVNVAFPSNIVLGQIGE